MNLLKRIQILALPSDVSKDQGLEYFRRRLLFYLLLSSHYWILKKKMPSMKTLKISARLVNEPRGLSTKS